jgi:hypothetical protein
MWQFVFVGDSRLYGNAVGTICLALVLPYPMSVQDVPGEAEMGILIVKVLASWSLVAMVAGLGLGAAIRRGERVRKDEFLSCVFASLESLQASRS